MAIFNCLGLHVQSDCVIQRNSRFIGFPLGLMGIVYETGGDVVGNLENHR